MSTTTNSVSAKSTSMSVNTHITLDHSKHTDLFTYYTGPVVSEYIAQRCHELHTEKRDNEKKNIDLSSIHSTFQER